MTQEKQDEAPEHEATEDEEKAMEEVQEEAAKERENERGYQ